MFTGGYAAYRESMDTPMLSSTLLSTRHLATKPLDSEKLDGGDCFYLVVVLGTQNRNRVSLASDSTTARLLDVVCC
jgi:hypothetical protein